MVSSAPVGNASCTWGVPGMKEDGRAVNQNKGGVLREAPIKSSAGGEAVSWEQVGGGGQGSGEEAALQSAPGSWASEPNLPGAVLFPAARPRRCRRRTGL